MAAPIRQISILKGFPLKSKVPLNGRQSNCSKISNMSQETKRFMSTSKLNQSFWKKSGKRLAMAGALALGGGALTLGFRWNRMMVRADSSAAPNFTPTKLIRYNKDNHGLKLTLFQFQTCPFCCKTRAFLDYYGISYDVVEVNSVTKKQLKWSQYKKVPVLVVNGVGKDGFLQLNESSVIMSLLESYLINPKYKLEELKSYYPCIESKEGRKVVYDFPNRYYVMYGADVTKQVYDERKQERKWRFWSDDNLVHVLSPNVYRTMSESLATFRYFSDVGDWEKNFSRFERLTVIYVGATVMYFVGKMLKKKHKLKKDVRESLYDSCREWTRALGTKQPFMGGKNPDLSDLAVYGVLSSIEGCEAFQDALKHTKIGPWYNRTKEAVKNNLGASVPLRK